MVDKIKDSKSEEIKSTLEGYTSAEQAKKILDDAERKDVLDTDLSEETQNTKELVAKADLNTSHKEQVLQAVKQTQSSKSQDFKMDEDAAKKALNLNTNNKQLEAQLDKQFPEEVKSGDSLKSDDVVSLNKTKAAQERQADVQVEDDSVKDASKTIQTT